MTSSVKKPKKKIPLPLKRVRKEMPPAGQVFEDKKKYDRRKAKEELKRLLRQRGH